ncbi:SCO-spondin, partial [Madurella mycetomatis]
MPPKTREYYLARSPGRDFAWFSFRTLAAPQHPKSKAEPTPTYSVPKPRRTKMQQVADASEDAFMPPADVSAVVGAATAQSIEAGPNTSTPEQLGSGYAGPWSEWYVSEDRNYFWRARQTPDETWDYQYTPGYQQPQPRSGSLTSAAQQEPSTSFPGPSAVGAGRTRDPASPKCSWPTIITTSTGQQTELSTSSTRTLTTLDKEVDDGSKQATSSALVPLVITAKSPPARSTRSKRPVGPVMRLLQEGRSRKARSEVNKSTAVIPTAGGGASTPAPKASSKAKGKAKLLEQDDSAVKKNSNNSAALTKARLANAKKLHSKVKSEKELKVDSKRRVRVWLKGLEVDRTPIPLDEEGFSYLV